MIKNISFSIQLHMLNRLVSAFCIRAYVQHLIQLKYSNVASRLHMFIEKSMFVLTSWKNIEAIIITMHQNGFHPWASARYLGLNNANVNFATHPRHYHWPVPRDSCGRLKNKQHPLRVVQLTIIK